MTIQKHLIYGLLLLSVFVFTSATKANTLFIQKQISDIVFSDHDAEFTTTIQTSNGLNEITAKPGWSTHRNGEDSGTMYTLSQTIDSAVLVILDFSISTTNQEESVKFSIDYKTILQRPATSNIDRIFINGAEEVKLFEILSLN